jgi:hypothetical protein
MTAGRRRRNGRKTRKIRGGAMYGFNQGEAIGVGAASVNAVDNTQFYNSETGQPRTGGRRRKSRKGGRKSRRRQRGGASQVSMGTTYASFAGTGERGIANYEQGVVQGNKF